MTVAPTAPAPDPAAARPVAVTERRSWSVNGFLGLLVVLLLGYAAVQAGQRAVADSPTGVPSLGSLTPATLLAVLALVLFRSLRVVQPGQALVVQFFGRYLGTVRRTGLVTLTPLTTARRVSVRVNNFDTPTLKVNDATGNPVEIAAIVVWQIADTAKALFSVENAEGFVRAQAEAAVRHVARSYPYDAPAEAESLRGSTDEVSAELTAEVAQKVLVAGIHVLEVRISHLAYAPEIAQAMLQRQQAAAVVAARSTIVQGAVGMVREALDELNRSDIVDLDEERKAAMVSNLLVVLCGDSRVSPIVNAGTLYG